jgi:3-carboxy-cis,cis-muconate cycloisomerase
LVDLLDEHLEVKLDRKELEKLCDPANYLGLSVEMIDRVLRNME